MRGIPFHIINGRRLFKFRQARLVVSFSFRSRLAISYCRLVFAVSLGCVWKKKPVRKIKEKDKAREKSSRILCGKCCECITK